MIVVITVLAACIMGLLLYGYCSNHMLKTEHYQISMGRAQEESVRIVMLADLHANTFGKGNRKLIRKIKEQKPDMICIAGDMTVKNGKGMDSCLALCKELLSVCPVYYAPGNHEIRMEGYEEYTSKLIKEGVFWLDNEYCSIFLKGCSLGVYGLNIGEFFYHKFWQKRDFTSQDVGTMLGPAREGEICILLAHNPEYFLVYREWGADLVLSGHVHGGIAKFPLLGGVIDPSLRLFPKYDSGLFHEKDCYMVLSRGLGTHHIRLRFFNRPEISVISLER